MKIAGQIVDIHAKRIYGGEITLKNGRIAYIEEKPVSSPKYILPGFIDAHVHIESSMLTPVEFARLAVCHGTVATISDPHEIANVMGMEGVEFMIENGKKSPLKFNFGAPSCVPATAFETAGATLGPDAIRTLLENPDIKYLAEMMNFPGVLYQDKEVMEKIAIAKELGKPIDGHAPGLRGKDAANYVAAGISTDHECFTYEEGLEKLNLGMKILIREGSAAKNFEALIPLLGLYPDKIMFCSDDKHPDDLILGHINQLAARAVAKGHDIFSVLKAACLNPIDHYNMEVGQLRVGDPADFIVVDDVTDFQVQQTWIEGVLVAEAGESFLPSVETPIINQFNAQPKKPEDFHIHATADTIRVIEAKDGELITDTFTATAKTKNGLLIPDPEQDVLKITVVNRYQDAAPAVAFIKGFGFKTGAIASCVGHDSHNIIAVGSDDEQLCRAVNLVIKSKGGISAVKDNIEKELPLPIAGIMSPDEGTSVGKAYAEIDAFTKHMGSTLKAPFMTLSFMGLLVIPSLKLSDKGLFDGNKFEFIEVNIQ